MTSDNHPVELSVVIPTYRGAARLGETLRALSQASIPAGGVELIVADDGSEPAIALPHPVRVVRHSPNRGRAATCNLGVSAARGRLILILDDDMSIHPETLVGHVEAHRRIGAAQGIIGRVTPSARQFTGRFGRFLAAEEEQRMARLAAAARLSFRDCLTGHFSIPRETLLQVGGYSERFSRYGFEDIELAWRLQQRGIGLSYRDDLVAEHRSEHSNFRTHCLRHLESGRMACLFAESNADPEVRAFLRIDNPAPATGSSRFRRLLQRTHRWARRCPAPLAPPLLMAARGAVHLMEWCAPDRWLHAGYHIVRDLHYARGLARGER